MKKNLLKKTLLLLFTLLAGVGSAHAEDFDYEWVKITDLSLLEGGETVLLVDQSKNLALSPLNGNYGLGLKGVDVAIGEDNVVRNVSADMIWTIGSKSGNSFTFNNNGKPLNGSLSSPSVSVTNEPYGQCTNEFFLDEYGDNGGKMYYVGNTDYEKAYFSWSTSDDKTITIDSETQARFTLYKKGNKVNYVKWKKVNDTDVTPINNEVVVIVDLNSGSAMSNDKADKDPDAVAMNLNDSKDRILGDVAEKVQWTFTNVEGGYHFAVGEKNLYADSEGLKVGTETTNNGFSFSNNDNGPYMGITIDNTQYFAGVDASMFSNVWKLVTEDDDLAKNTQPAIFKKIVNSQKVVTITMAENYFVDFNEVQTLNLNATITGADFSAISWTSSDTDVATVANGIVTLKKRGSVVITARVNENEYHDKASATCTVRIDDSSLSEPGSTALNPLSVADAKKLAETGKVTVEGYSTEIKLQPGVNYYIKGKVCKVNSGMMAMFGDMDFGEMMGNMGDGNSTGQGGGNSTGEGGGNSTGEGSGMNFDEMMDDMDFDMDDMGDMGDMGFDMSSMGFDMSAFFGSSDKVTYYISDDGVKDKEKQLKVLNGLGTLKSNNGGAIEYNNIPKLSPGDCVVVCGPLEYSEDTNMLSSLMSNGDDEPKMSWKVGELNYLAKFDPTLLVEDKEIYVNKTLEASDVYSIDNYFDDFSNQMKIIEGMTINEATFKSSDEEIAKWDEDSKKIVGVNEGKAKITVKVKVILQDKTEDQDERSYTMKRKFKLIVKTRDLDPAGYYDGDWVLTTSAADLKEGTRLVLAGTRVKEGKEDTDYMMVENNAMMGGGKNGSKIEFDANDTGKTTIPSSTVISKGGLEVVLEKADENGTSWYLNVGEDETGAKLYLYASVKEESTNNGNDPSTPANNENEPSTGNGGGFNMDEMMEMFNPSSGLKVGTNEKGDSLKAIISISDGIATIKFPTVPDTKNNTIMLSSSFDMESMMGMFGGMGGNNENEGEDPDNPEGNNEQTEEESTFDMGSFDMFMASFNTKKPGDDQPTVDENGETKAPKCFMPRIYRFVPDESFNIEIGTSKWKTIVTYKDVSVPENVDAYIVTKINQATSESEQSLATLSKVENLKGGAPYLLHTSSPASYEMTLLTPNGPDQLVAPENNKLLKSDRKTAGADTNSEVYVLASKTQGVGFYQWIGGDLGSGRVYLPVTATTGTVREFVAFGEESTAIQNIESTESNTGIFYDLQGRRVNNPTNGIYIVNGKKAIIK